MTFRKIAFIGAGNMTKAIVEGLVAKGYDSNMIMASNPSRPKLDELENKLGIKTSQHNENAIAFSQVIVLSVKPQLMASVCSDFLSKVDLAGKLVISIAAGIECQRLRQMLGGFENLVRVMPNTPSSIGYGMSGIYAANGVSHDDAQFAAFLMNHVGQTLLVDKESDIDTVIAAAGSSPAYFFYVAQAMQQEAMNMGLSENDARKLVQQAMLGSAQMMQANEEVSLASLRENVTSKGGTTHEAVKTLQKHDVAHIFSEAMRAAVKRAKQMAKEF
ncbi:pyrroline-5-carboxylate reductase [Ningiella sp. W23]|uniref:pyrroline-5-carboxylate reductase n=1 Tax=Ningiella sp. W23 TaxID=3023715 RepID=UPI003756575A